MTANRILHKVQRQNCNSFVLIIVYDFGWLFQIILKHKLDPKHTDKDIKSTSTFYFCAEDISSHGKELNHQFLSHWSIAMTSYKIPFMTHH